jgi:hypothetical protein
VRPHHEITNIPELQPGQPLRGAGRGATAFYGVRGGWSGIATGYLLVLYIKATVFVYLFVCVGSAWNILPITARSLWSVLGGGGRESPVKHGARGASRGGGGGGHERGRTGRVHYAPGSH